MKEIFDKLDYVKIKDYSAKNNVKIIRKTTDWEKIFAKDILDKELLSKIHKELLKLKTEKTNKSTKKWARSLPTLHQ